MRRAIVLNRGVARSQTPRCLSTVSSDGGRGAGGRGRGKGALNQYINAHRDTVKGFQEAGAGASPRGGKGVGGKGGGFGGKGKGGGRGGGGKGGSRQDGGSFRPTLYKFEPGQFDDAAGAVGSTADAVEAIIEATENSPDGLLIIDYSATDAENAKVAERFDQSNPRSIEKLLGYSSLSEALGDEGAEMAQPSVHDAWAVQAANPYITHDQRVDVAKHMEAQLADIVKSNRGYLEYALTPPDDYLG